MPVSKTYNCDCIDILRSMPDKSISLILTDAPYGNASGDFKRQDGSRFGGIFDKYKPDNQPPLNRGGDSKTVTRTGGTWASKYGKKIIDWDFAPSQEYFDEMFRVGQHCILWGGNYFALPATRCFIVWKKLTISEEFSMAMAEYAWTDFNENAKVFEGAPQGKKNDKRFHPCQKPVELFSFCLKHFAKPGDTILDPFMGSGSSRIAAWKAGLDYIGVEADETYYRLEEERFERFRSQINLFVDEEDW